MKWFESVKERVSRKACAPVMALCLSVGAALPAYAADTGTTTGTISDMLDIFSQLFAWILEEGATLLTWMLDKPILMISMGLFFCGAIIAFLMRIYHSV